MIHIKTKQCISLQDWDYLVEKTYGRPYDFQQQAGCRGRGNYTINIPEVCEEFENDTIPEEINGMVMGVSFAAWLARDKDEWNGSRSDRNFVHLFWQRNFYPDIQMVANDLYEKGLIPAGTYDIEIDW